MDSESTSGLFCRENVAFSDEEEVLVDDDLLAKISSNDDVGDHSDIENGYVEMMVNREVSLGFKNDQSLVLEDWMKCARLEAISWILKTRVSFGFRFHTAYLSITYFDRFLSRRSIDSEKSWALKLLSVACLSLAAKMEEIEVPALTDFQIEDYNFGSQVIQRMELLVLNTLEWRMFSITPFAFLRYFFIKFCKESPPRHVVSRTVGLILAVMKEINLMDRRPSVVAAAATLAALDKMLTRSALECKMSSSVSSSGFLEIEDVFQCYSLMQKLEVENLDTLKIANSPDLSPVRLRPTDVSENPSVSSALSNKRRRLTFNTSDQNPGIPDDKQHG